MVYSPSAFPKADSDTRDGYKVNEMDGSQTYKVSRIGDAGNEKSWLLVRSFPRPAFPGFSRSR